MENAQKTLDSIVSTKADGRHESLLENLPSDLSEEGRTILTQATLSWKKGDKLNTSAPFQNAESNRDGDIEENILQQTNQYQIQGRWAASSLKNCGEGFLAAFERTWNKCMWDYALQSKRGLPIDLKKDKEMERGEMTTPRVGRPLSLPCPSPVPAIKKEGRDRTLYVIHFDCRMLGSMLLSM
ncbi:hypothetical protein RRG08_056424 [Elysia crispata]|uniref:Uncharacterized protein n=1 Tax=Elysia crispata TaxID=231223 RepID=A0AAE1B6X1_9GAST|nr:hypothetical protein RRG08_056424 [Elysia crispata]